MAEARKTWNIVTQGEDGKEVEHEVSGTSAAFDESSQRLTILDGDEPVAGFIRLLRWVRKNS